MTALYTPKQRRKLAEAFKLARRSIRRQESRYICSALSTSWFVGDISITTECRAKDLILSRLNDCPTYTAWVEMNYPDTYNTYDMSAARRARLAWLDSLIEEFST